VPFGPSAITTAFLLNSILQFAHIPRPLIAFDGFERLWRQPKALFLLLYGGRRFRTFNILDEGVREVLAIEVDTSLPDERVILTCPQLLGHRSSSFTPTR
jgi:hypothetical protein